MGDKTGIEWTDATWNPIRGCSRVSKGCRNCYAETVAKRFSGPGLPYEGLIAKGGQWNGKTRLVDYMIDQPLRWRKPRRIFVNSMSDLFHESVPFHTIDEIFGVMAITTRHTYQILTKRPERMLDYISSRTKAAYSEQFADHGQLVGVPDCITNASVEARNRTKDKGYDNCGPLWPLCNVWLGVSVEDQATAEERIPQLLQCRSAMHWISAEPLLGPLDLSEWLATPYSLSPTLDWVVVGGESGKDARPMNPDWVRHIREQCTDSQTPFLFKQWGEFAPNWLNELIDGEFVKQPNTEWMDRVGKKHAGRELDGQLWDEYPEAL